MKKRTIGSIAIVTVVLLFLMAGIFVALKKRSNVAETGNVLGVSWYQETGTEFTITTAEELYEFAQLSDYYNFAKQTIKLGADIVVNEGNAQDWGENAPAKRWKPIKNFSGTFDGQGHTISGLYMKGFDVSLAVFTETKMSATVQDFKLTNTYINTMGSSGVASISSGGGGTFKRIYSDAIIRHDGGHVGGLFSSLSMKTVVEECCYDGSIETTKLIGGGIVDEINGANVTMSHVLFSGSITSTYADGGSKIGGLVGTMEDAGSVLKLDDSLITGKIKVGNMYYTGTAIGVYYAGTAIETTNSYSSDASYDVVVGRSGAQGTSRGVPADIRLKDITGDQAYVWTTLDFEKYWTTVVDDTPNLQCFASEVRSTAGLEKAFDLSWYDESKSEFVLTNMKELYGFRVISMGNDFKGKTVKLGADIVVNTGDAKNFAKEEPAFMWSPIGKFAGTFDGQGHSISGLYINTSSDFKGLFAETTLDATVKNFKLVNSYYRYTGRTTATMGGITGRGNGVYENIYTNVIIDTNGQQTGGLIGAINADHENRISNCWFDGEIRVKDGGRYVGGIVSNVVKGDNLIEHCLSTGTLVNETVNTGIHLGGIVGVAMNNFCKLTLNDCLYAGNIETVYDVCVGAVMGRVASAKVTIQNTYATEESYTHKTDGFRGIGNNSTATVSGSVIAFPESMLSGVSAYQWTMLDFDNFWAAQSGKTPVLKMFATKTLSLAGVKKNFDVSWYKADATSYVLDSREDLYGFYFVAGSTNFKDKTVKLGKDITVNTGSAKDWANATPTYTWYPIPSFAGTFDGQGKTISGLYINTSSSYAGLFGTTVPGSTIKNVKVTNSYFNSTASMAAMGSIAGQMGGIMDTVYSNAILTSTGTQVGGLVGRINNSGKDTFTVNNCWFDGSVTVTSENQKAMWTGGIVGTIVQGTLNMSNVLNTGAITYAYDNIKYDKGQKAFPAVWVGGIFGGIMNGKVLNKDGSIKRVGVCNLTGALNVGDVIVTAAGETHLNGLGAIFGYTSAKDTVINYKDVYALKDSCIKAHQYNTSYTTVNGSVVSWDEKMLSGDNGYKYTTLDFSKYWATVVNPDSTPILASFASSKPSVAGLDKLIDITWYDKNKTEYTIDTLAKLYGFYALSSGDNFKGKTVKLGADITINSGDADTFATSAPANEWYSIASLDKPFAGTFDGQGHTIYGMYMDTTSRFPGLFASTTKDAVIKNLRLKEAYIKSTVDGFPQAGSVVGLASGTIDNIYSDAIVSAEGNYVGGIVGRTSGQLKMTRCWYDGTLTVKGKYTGGVLGVNEGGNVTIENCLNTGTIVNTYTKDLYPHVGGIIGAVLNENANGVIRNCVNTGRIDIQGFEVASGSAVGAIIGRYGANTTGTVENAYYTSESFMLGISTNTAGKDKDDEKVILDERFVKIPECYLNGIGAYRYTDLNFATTWSVIDGDAPALKCIKSGMDITTAVKTDTSWYNANSSAYEIDTVGKLYGLTKLALKNNFAGKTITLTADMPVNGDWMPIGAVTEFQGVFNGDMHAITGIQVKTDVPYAGLFGWTGMQSRIENVKLLDSKIESSYEGRGYTGSVAGLFAGNMNQVYSNAEVIAKGDEAAGIIGRLTGNGAHQISNVWFDGSVTSYGKQDISCVGGVIGRVFLGQSVMKNCLNTGSVTHNVATAGASWAGGLVGGVHCDMGSSYTVTLAMNNCLNTGKVTTLEAHGAGTIIGRARRPVSFVNVYTSNDISCNGEAPKGDSTVTGVGSFSGTGNTLIGSPVIKSVAQLSGAQARYNTTFDFYLGAGSNGTWVARNGQETKDKMPGLKAFVNESAWYVADEVMVADKAWYQNNTSATTYKIGTAAELFGLAQLSETVNFNGKTIKLTNDIVFNNGDKDDWDETEPVNHWVPIGRNSLNFLGSFDGQGHTISGIYLDATERYSGFFGPINCPSNQTREIKDFRLVNSYTTYSGSTDNLVIWLGGVISSIGAGSGGQVTVSDIYTDVEVYAPNINDVGGIVARIGGNNTKIERCQFDGKLTLNQFGGGIVSRMDGTGITVRMIDCLSSGKIYATVNNAGGLIGGTATDNGKNNHLYLTDCVSDCEMSVASQYVSGSLIGRLRNTDTVHVDDVYTTENITARNNGTMVFKPGYRGICVNGSEGTVTGDAATVVIDANTTYELEQDLWTVNNDNIPELIPFMEGYSEVDTSWYENEPLASSYTLTTRAQFLGFAQLSKEMNFEGKTINLGANITLNTSNAANWGTKAPAREWPQIGSSVVPFKGVFNGNNHTISGIYVNAENLYAGLFAAVEGTTCEIKNFKLVNSYFTSSCTANDIYLGSIAGRGNAKFINIYSSAYVHANTSSPAAGQVVGGLVGGITAGTYNSFEQCQYAGSLRFHWYGGGILGIIQNSGTKVTMTNCLSTASIYSEMHNTGGICGNVSSGTVLDINHCVSDLTSMSVPSAFCSGSVISRVNGGTATIVNVYTTNNVVRRDNGGLPDLGYTGIVGIGTGAGGTITNNVGPTVISSTTTYNLDTNIWTIGTDNVPYLTQFANVNP